MTRAPEDHLGAATSALVDGELDHLRRERVLAHLAHCPGCRAEVDAQRRFKAALRQVPGPPVPDALRDRLLGLSAPRDVAAGSLPQTRWRPVGPPRRPGRRGPGTSPSHAARSRRRRRLVGSALVAFGLGGALALGGPAPREPSAPVDPASPSFATQYVSTVPQVPFTEPDVVSASLMTR